MPSPFPGMDPFIEATGIWSSFHHALITACHDQLNERLPPDYAATMEERVLFIEDDESGETRRTALPDVAVIHEPTARPSRPRAGAVATIEPHTLPQECGWLDEPRQLYIRVIHLPHRRLVTDIEILSPTNKRRGDDRVTYLARRRELMLHQVHLVEIDLLLAGDRLPMLAPLPAGDFFAFVTRWETGRHCDVYAWSIRQSLPTIPVPLRTEDGQASLDLASAFAQTYQRGRYDRLLRYEASENLLLDTGDREWAAARLTSAPRV